MTNNIPFIEKVYRWIDYLCLDNYPESIREKSMELATSINWKPTSKPSNIALASILSACNRNIETGSCCFNILKMKEHVGFKRHDKRSGFKIETVKRYANVIDGSPAWWEERICQ